jgi:hypothetical protein
MRARALFSLVGALVAAVALVSASGAATTKAHKATRIDVSTRAAVVHYLRSHHVNAKGAVIERGLRNYAGAHCPGVRWACASTRHTVVQIAKRGGQNRFVCRSSRCAVVQFAGVSHGVYIRSRHLASTAVTKKGNVASCIKTTGLGASCSIMQSGSGTTGNQATVWEDAGKQSGLTQTALYSATITQTATGSGANLACVHQSIFIDGSTTNTKSTGATVTLEAHQSIIVKQDSTSGNNTAENATNPSTGVYQCDSSALSQDQRLQSIATSKGSITQNEDAALTACGDAVSGDYANLCLNIAQNQSTGFKCTSSDPNSCPATGNNTANFTQTSTQTAVANTPAGPVNQTQSSICPSSCQAPGGLVGTVNQDSQGVSTATPTQTETQCEDADTGGLTLTACSPTPSPPDSPNILNGLTQTQYGPVGVGRFRHNHRGRQLYGHLKGLGTAMQHGNTADTYTITQTSTQNSDSGSTQQNFGQADCHTSGNCTATQNTNINGTPNTTAETGSDVNTQTSCTGSSCTSTCNSTCTISDTRVLIAGTGDFSHSPPTEPNDNLAQALTTAGYSVTESATLPADLNSFGQVWWVDATPMTSAEQTQLINFEKTGRGIYLTGERPCCETLNAADQTIVNSVVSAGGITVGGQGDVCGCNSPLPVNPTVVGNLATQPHTVTSWQPNAPGGMAGVPASSVFSYYQPDEFTTQVVAAAWDRPSTVGSGRLVVFMDINWPEVGSRAANWSDVAENVAFFLSGLSSPPSPILAAAPFTATALLGLGAFTTHPGATSRTAVAAP